MQLRGGPRPPADPGAGFDRRDFAPPGTRFDEPGGGPDRVRRRWPDGGRWRRPALVGIGALVLVLAVVLSVRGGDDPSDVAGPDPSGDPTSQQAPGADPSASAAAEQADGTDATRPAGDGVTPAGTSAYAPIPERLSGATTFAVQFANTYLNYDSENAEVRERGLAAYLAPGMDPQLGWSGDGRQVAALTIPVSAVEDGDQVTVVVAAQVTGDQAPRWVHLRVPLARDADGGLAVVATPSFVPRPPPGRPDVPTVPAADPVLSSRMEADIAAVMTAFGRDPIVKVEGLTDPTSEIPGLGGLFALQEVVDVQVHDDGEAQRTATVTVRWDSEVTGGALTQSYRLGLLLAGEDRWVITDIAAR